MNVTKFVNKKALHECDSCHFFEMKWGKAFRFHSPSSILVVGPSGSGKTFFTEKLILNNSELFEIPPKSIHYCYGAWQDGFKTMEKNGIKFHEGIPDTEDLSEWFPEGGLLIMDDLMDEGSGDKRVLDLFTKHSHHQNITVIYLCQDMFPTGKFSKSISRNAHYIIAFKNPRDQLGVRNLFLQAFPNTWKTCLQEFQNVTERPFGYLLIDLHPGSSDDVRLLSHVLKDEGHTRCYQRSEKV